MSLGAIDFGLIVDGSVIVVENAARRLSEASRRAGRRLPADERMQVIQDSTLEVRGAAVFGEIIIAIVYLPILALTGMEGKLFHPMAFTVLLALGGAFIVSLTVVPVLTSYFVKPHPDERETLLVRMVHHHLHTSAASRAALAVGDDDRRTHGIGGWHRAVRPARRTVRSAARRGRPAGRGPPDARVVALGLGGDEPSARARPEGDPRDHARRLAHWFARGRHRPDGRRAVRRLRPAPRPRRLAARADEGPDRRRDVRTR
jgi:hypothetical protein